MDNPVIDWRWASFAELPGDEVYQMLALRESVFVVEQQCAYQEADGYDEEAAHLFGRDQTGRLAAYGRVLPPLSKYAEPSIGRLVVSKDLRGTGLGALLIRRCIAYCEEHYSGQAIMLSAQFAIKHFYEALGFAAQGKPYDDAGIEHIDMVYRS